MDDAEQLMVRVRSELLPAEGWETTLRTLADEAAQAIGQGIEAAHVYADAHARELSGSTLIGMGLAVPHARVPGLKRVGVYLACSRAGIAWPQEKAKLIALLVVPLEMPELHLQLLAQLVRWRRSLDESEVTSPGRLAVGLSRALG